MKTRNGIKYIALIALTLIGIQPLLAFDKKPGSQIDRNFYFSKQFAERFGLPASGAVTDWHGTIGVSINHMRSLERPRCSVTLYLGNDIKFEYPPEGSFTNFLGQHLDELFFFQQKLDEKDEAHLSEQSLKGLNKITLEGYNDNNEITKNALVIGSINKDVVPGIHVINSNSYFCDVFGDNINKVKLVIYGSVKQGNTTKTETIEEFKIPASKK